MLKTLFAVCALLCALMINADARPRKAACTDTDVMRPVCGMACNLQGKFAGSSAGFLTGVRSIRVTIKRERVGTNRHQNITGNITQASFGAPSPSLEFIMRTGADRVTRPGRYIAGRLICAINVNAALAERGIKGTGSALARSFDGWGTRVAQPVPGAVAVTDRRGGGHVAIVSRVEGSRVFVWNPGTRGRGWQEVEYTNRHARYRVAG